MPVGGIAADSLGGPRIGELCFADRAELHRQRRAGLRRRHRRRPDSALGPLRVAVEPGGAAALAALLAGVYRPAPGERVGVLLCGANTGAVNFG